MTNQSVISSRTAADFALSASVMPPFVTTCFIMTEGACASDELWFSCQPLRDLINSHEADVPCS